jgi:AcrR family transcriptional regulator
MAELDLEGVPATAQAKLGFAAEKHGQIWNQDTYKLVFDMAGVGMHNPKMREKIGSFLQDRREFITRITDAVMREAPRRPRASAEAISAAIWGAFLGIALQRLIDPNFDGDAALDALEEMTDSLASAPRRATKEEK